MGENEHVAHIAEHMSALREKIAERDKLMRDLEHSLEVERLWPQAFNCGSVRAKLLGDFWKPSSLVLSIQRKDGEQHEVPIREISESLLRHHMEIEVPEHLWLRILHWWKTGNRT